MLIECLVLTEDGKLMFGPMESEKIQRMYEDLVRAHQEGMENPVIHCEVIKNGIIREIIVVDVFVPIQNWRDKYSHV